ncbi:MAG: hypothetical protein OXL34_10570 [Gemmatimonadota bacterium]|nr:hypothetical protein [Gemmatimonadota bacterium]
MMKCGLVCLAGVVVAVVAGACEVPPPTAIAPAAGKEVAAAARTDEKAREPGFQMPGVDGDRLLIRGVNRLPSLSLSAEDVAANPLVLVDGVLVEGGLNELLAGEPLDIRGIGYSSAPGSFGDFGDESGRGIVLISTVGETAGSGVEWMLSGQEVRERVRAALERGREAAERGREAAERGREAAQRGREAAERGREAAERGMKAAERGREAAERGMKAAERGREAAERGREALERSKDSWDHQRDAWQHDPATAEAAGWVIIRNVQGRPVLWLSPGSAATNPPVVIDGVVLEGGLDALSSLEPLDIVRLGYLGSKRGVFITTRR